MRPHLPAPASPIAPHILAFIAHKRALNRRYRVEEKALFMFDRYMTSVGAMSLVEITPPIIDAFLIGRSRTRPRSFNHLVGVVRRLFEWMVQHSIIDSSPVTASLRRGGQARIPYIFDLAAAQRLIDVCVQLPDQNGALLRGSTYATIFSLLYGLGLRVGEAARLCFKDVDRERNILTIRETKFSKSRLIPMGPRIAERLYDFIALRQQRTTKLLPNDPLFSFRRGRPLNPGTISQTFHALVPKLGLDLREGGTQPHAHDLRHSFAVGTVLRWYRCGGNPADKLMMLSTFLGHVDPASTAVYLTITPELLDAAGQRFERFAAPISGGSRT